MAGVRWTASLLVFGLLAFATSSAIAQRVVQSTNGPGAAAAGPAPAEPPPGPESSESGIPPRADQSKKSDEKPKTPQTAAKEERRKEHKPADPDTGQSTLSEQTLGLLP